MVRLLWVDPNFVWYGFQLIRPVRSAWTTSKSLYRVWADHCPERGSARWRLTRDRRGSWSSDDPQYAPWLASATHGA